MTIELIQNRSAFISDLKQIYIYTSFLYLRNPEPKEPAVECEYCGISITGRNYKRHTDKVHANGRLGCHKCPYKAPDRPNLKQHFQRRKVDLLTWKISTKPNISLNIYIVDSDLVWRMQLMIIYG